MMKVEDLKIGNWVLDSFEKKQVIIWGVQSNHDKVDLNYANGSGIYSEYLEYIKPIELTEDWLLKMGFEFSESEMEGEIIVNKESRFSAIKAKGFYSVGLAGPFGLFLVKIKYVHQLQNLYYSLFNEELELNKK